MTQNLELEKMGLEAISTSERKEVTGGFWQVVVGWFIVESITNPKSSADALKKGWDSL